MTSKSPRRLRRSPLALVIGLCLGCLASCGYSSGVRLPQGAESVGVSVFDNLSPLPEIERELFAASEARVQAQVGEMLAASEARIAAMLEKGR